MAFLYNKKQIYNNNNKNNNKSNSNNNNSNNNENSHKSEIRDYIFSQRNLFASIQGLVFDCQLNIYSSLIKN